MRRRSLLTLPAAGLFAAAAAKVRLEKLEVFRVRVNHRGGWILVRVTASGGLTGIGDASHGYNDKVTLDLLPRFFEMAKQRTALDIEPLRQAAWPVIRKQGRPAAVAFSGLEQCLWDIAGKALGVPAHALFGGLMYRKIRNYANINRASQDRSPEAFARLTASAMKDGFTAVKLAAFDGMPRRGDAAAREAHTRTGLACIRAAREALGPRNDLLIDGHSNFDLERGLALARELEPLNLFWLEEAAPGIPALAAINRAAAMPTAGGESLFGVEGFFPYLAGGAVDIAMPDVKYCGGMLELKKIAAMAEGAGLLVSPHGPASPVGNIAAAHVCATLANFQILEFAYGECDWRSGLIDPPEQLENGLFTLSDRPGFGVTLNESVLRAHLSNTD